jgi:signal transduction histidine kinase/CheY-like chemotaxis protein
MSDNKQDSIANTTKNPYAANYVFDALNRLLVRILESVKADKAALVFEKDGRLTIEAEVVLDKKGVHSQTLFQLNSNPEIRKQVPLTIVQSAIDNGVQLFVDEPVKTSIYSEDVYFKANQPAFVFCSAVYNETIIQGALYIESKKQLTFDPEERKRLFRLWTDQASLSIENAKWFTSLQEHLTDRMHEISEARSKNLARIRFLADMNYEVRAPLNSIMGFSQLLQKKGIQLDFPADVKRYLENIQSSSSKLAEMLDNILDYARVEAGSVDLNKENIDLSLLIHSVYLANRHFLEKRDVSFQIQLPDDFPDLIFSDRSALTKILMTIAKFSILRSPAGKTVYLKGLREKDGLVVSISDNGGRIAPKMRETLFIAFSALKNENARLADESSLELAIAKQLVDRLHGNIQYQTLPDGLSQIVLKIPCPIQKIAESVPASWKTGRYFSAKNRVLLLEDHLSDWTLLVSMLKDLGVGIWSEVIAPERLTRFIEIKPHLIFIDMHMPGMDEKAKIFVRYLKTTPELAEIPLVAITTDKFHRKYQLDYPAGTVEFLTKPFGIYKLIEVLKKHLIISSETPDPVSLNQLPDRRETANYARVLESADEISARLSAALMKDLEELSSIPIFKGGTIINRLKQIGESHKISDHIYSTLMMRLKSAVYEGNAERFRIIIKRAMEGKYS